MHSTPEDKMLYISLARKLNANHHYSINIEAKKYTQTGKLHAAKVQISSLAAKSADSNTILTYGVYKN
jgi:hypothetical protein